MAVWSFEAARPLAKGKSEAAKAASGTGGQLRGGALGWAGGRRQVGERAQERLEHPL